jgi:hypothetical protein
MAPHPYYPTDLKLPGFAPAVLPFQALLGGFAVAVLVIAGATWLFSARFKFLTRTERMLACWFAVTGAPPPPPSHRLSLAASRRRRRVSLPAAPPP